MREYQRKRNNPYRLPHNLYMRALYMIRDYDRIKADRQEIYYASAVGDGMPRGNAITSVTENKAVRLARLGEECDAVEKALNHIPPEYRKGVFDNICYGAAYPITADYSTYSRWRQRFIYWVAANLGQI